MKGLRSKTRGAASLITVIFVSIVLSIMVLGFVRLAVNEQRQSTDDDLTTRAFYAAESGLEDAQRAIRDYLDGDESGSIDDLSGLNADVCTLPNGYSGILSTNNEFDTEYTCMVIDLTPSNYEITLNQDEAKNIELRTEGGAGYTNVLVEWHLKDAIPDGDGRTPARRGNVKTLPREDQWRSGANNFPAMLRTTLFSYDDNAISRGALNSSMTVAFLNPSSSDDGAIDYGTSPGSDYGVHNADCSDPVPLLDGDYVCSQLFRVNNATDNHVLRVTPMYGGTHVRVTLSDGVNTVNFAGEQALIDVTGRAGDVFRRIETRVSLEGSFADFIPDAAITSAEDVCKNMLVPSAANSSDFLDNDCSRP